MPDVRPMQAIVPPRGDVSSRIAPPYDVLDAESKAGLLSKSRHNIVEVDLPHLPAKTVGPDEAYERAGRTFLQWLDEGVLEKTAKPALFVYRQSFSLASGKAIQRTGLFAKLQVQEFGPGPEGKGGVYPHEQTFPAAKEDRLKLMRTTQAQLSPIFGLYSDPERAVGEKLGRLADAEQPGWSGRTDDGVLHEMWQVDDPAAISDIAGPLSEMDIFIADGHHRYHTALNYAREVNADDPNHPANFCLFALVAIQDEGMIVLPTHRVLGGMRDFSIKALADASQGLLRIAPFSGDSLEALEKALPREAEANGGHAMGLYIPGDPTPLSIVTTVDPDPLQPDYPDRSEAWRNLDVAILQHLIVEKILQPTFTNEVVWKFPHELDELRSLVESGDYQAGVVMRAPALESVRQVSEAGDLMPQKSTFFYPKLATGLVMNPLA